MSEPDWKSAYQRATQDATLALSSKAAVEAIASRLCPTDEELEAIEAAANHADWCDKEIDGVRFGASAVLRGFVARAKANRSMLEQR